MKTRLCFIFVLVLSVSNASADDFTALVTGVSQIVSLGAPGPVYPTDSAWVPIVGGDSDTSFPAVFVMARPYGLGRILIMGHDGLLTHLDLLDNLRFTLNVIAWLDKQGKKTVSCSTGHGEWVNQSSLVRLETELNSRGYIFQAAPFPLTESFLQSRGVLIVGNAWTSFSESEIESVRDFVEGGGGLLLIGLGWSWEPYHPGTTIEEYPMMKLAQIYGIRWLKPVISDPSNQLDGSPIFHVFYPHLEVVSLQDAFDRINQVHVLHRRGLPSFLETNVTERLNYIHAHQTLQVVTQELPAGDPQRQEVYHFLRNVVTDYPHYFKKSVTFDAQSFPHIVHVREMLFRTWIDALPLEADVKSEITAESGLYGVYQDIWNEFDIWLLDNNGLDAAQLQFLHTCLSLIPKRLHNLRAISVYDFLGNPTTPISLVGLQGQVNIFGVRLDQALENSFPDDVSPGIIPVFCGAVVHEINHVVDAFTVGGAQSSDMANRRKNLIDSAGTDRLNYLRSMIPDGFFKDAPQEFFASIANEWFTDNEKTLQLGLLRFEQGRLDPINQALFFAEVYSQGGDTTFFYYTDQFGNITRRDIPLKRDVNGRIIGMRVGEFNYSFELNTNGDVTSWSIASVSEITEL